MDEEDIPDKINHLRTLLKTYRARQRILEEQAASFGSYAPPHIQIEVENVYRSIQQAQSKLEQLSYRDMSDSTFSKNVNGLIIEQGSVGWEYDGTPYKNKEFEITFISNFNSPPIVQASISMIDTEPGETEHTVRFWVFVEGIDTKHARIKVGTWTSNVLYGCKVTWLALGE